MNQTYELIVMNYLSKLKYMRNLWYIVNPYETMFESPLDVPDYQQQIWVSFFLLIVLEQLILLTKKNKYSFRLNDHITSLSHWMLQESARIICRGGEYYVYIKIYDKYRIYTILNYSVWTWYITALSVDFCYYWVHRANHEIHFLWSQHQVHHSSEEFNLVVGLRQSILQQWCSFMFYLPLALFIPPSHFITHHQFNLIYQLWIHTTVINDLGPFEFAFNTPKHHRVHHGCNIYCLDKNYGGVLIIWDRLFGTFTEEQPNDEIVYGLVVSPRSFNPLYLQIFYTKAMLEKSWKMKTLKDKLSAVWKGPSWLPGLPRLGLDQYKTHVTSRVKYNPTIPSWQTFYIFLHFAVAFFTHFYIYDEKQDCGLLIINNTFTLTTIGLLFDCFEYANILEFIRCTIYLIIVKDNDDVNFIVLNIYFMSCCIWIFHIISVILQRMRVTN